MRVHRYWTGTVPPPFVAEYGAAWRALHPHWTITDWTDESLPLDIRAEIHRLSSAVHPEDLLRHRANIVRYHLLHKFGGLWADCDILPLMDFTPLMDSSPFAATMGKVVEGSILASGPNTSWTQDLVRISLPDSPGKCVDISGAYHLTRVTKSHPEVLLFPAGYFFTHDAVGRAVGGPHYSTHRWASSSPRAR